MVEDEMNLNQETKIKNIWYFKNQQPIVEAKRKGESQNFYGALNMTKNNKDRSKCVAMSVDKQNSETTIKFLKKLLKIYQNKKIFLIWDGASWHKSKKIREFLSKINKNTTKLELFNFPPYSPEYNPQEHVWKALRQNVTHNRLEKDFSILIKDCLKFLNRTKFSSIKFENLFK
ncbi:MAG: IS630 family transposase [Patescibacteria group bacterium]|nr:IS630 family transposase [Patescibacteria group bacterium]MBU0897867.1 IS630 family transposase [Patescibacteria group bacterium]MBU1062877.1 IS630 family transposase [Patescibacteria group bacterium]MBU1783416.1 IS630 family transposase [Patescibacteria group bacterium]